MGKNRRIIYAPEVSAYILTGTGRFLDLTSDIIEGSLTRRVNAPSTLTLKVQSRRNSRGEMIYGLGSLLPMDRIVVYLKKVKPILVFSGYLDLVPFYQPYAAPVTIEASCTLKRLEFTYWDPGLPRVIETLAKYGFVYKVSNEGAEGFARPDLANSLRPGEVQDTGFAALLRFLMQDVGGWNPDQVHIAPLPQGWINRVSAVWKQSYASYVETSGYLEAFLQSFLNSGSSGGSSEVSGVAGDWPGDDSPPEARALWLARNAKANDLPPELPVMAALPESGMRAFLTEEQSDRDSAGMFQMRSSIWERHYPGYKTSPAIQMKWFITRAKEEQKQHPDRFQEGKTENYGEWCQEIEISAHPDKYQTKLREAQELIQRGMTRYGGSLENRERDSADSSSPSSGGRKLVVLLEAGHAAPRQPGYTGQTGGNNEIAKNQAMVAAIKGIIRGNEDFRNNIEIYENYTGSAPPHDFDGDVYLSIHHDPDTYGSHRPVQVGLGYPGSWSTNQSGDAKPNIYAVNQGGDGRNQDPVRQVNTDTILNKNSGKLVARLSNVLGSLQTKSKTMTVEVPTSNKRMGNYYGFWYNKADAAAIVELPSLSNSEADYDINTVARGIVSALYTYHKSDSKEEAKNPSYTGSTLGSSGQSAANTGDSIGTSAKALIDVLVKYATEHPETPYQLGGQRGIKLEDADPLKPMDCSGFIGNGMISVGLAEKGYSPTTVTFYNEGEVILQEGEADPDKLDPGTFLILGGAGGAGANGHVMVYIGDKKVVECSSGGDGPRVRDYKATESAYAAVIHPKVGTTTQSASDAVSSSGGGGDGDAFKLAKIAAFNVAFNFPANALESRMLSGIRSLENDVKLFESVKEITHASMRVFSSLPDGDFIAWYPDYFNISGRNPWLVLSPMEIVNFNINMSDKNLATHVYVIGNPLGFGFPSAIQETGQNISWIQRLMGAGVATIEQPYILDSFIRRKIPKTQPNRKTRPRFVFEEQGSIFAFLERYGARPYSEANFTLRHPIMEFFHAYHTFMKKWAEQYVSKVELTFHPEMFPGMILELDQSHAQAPGFTFYIEEVTHYFSYTNGFTTNAVLSSPATTSASDNIWGMAIVRRPAPLTKPVKVNVPRSTKRNQRNKKNERIGKTARDLLRP